MVIGIKRVNLARDTERGCDTKSHIAVLGPEINTGDSGKTTRKKLIETGISGLRG